MMSRSRYGEAATADGNRQRPTTAEDERHSGERDLVMEVRNATVTFEMERGTARVLDDVSLGIERNEILGIVGESGSGKSMFASALLDAVDEPGVLDGEVRFYPEDDDPFDVTELEPAALRRFRWEEVSMVFQGAMSSFNPVRTLEASFVETFIAHDVPVADGMERARSILEDLYLEPDHVLESYPHELSGGMNQRALIALSLVLDPDVLVMDEPTAALDLLMQRSIISLLDELRTEYELSIVFITHDLSLVSGLVDRIAVMYAFDFVEVGPTMEVLTDPSHPYTRALLRSSPDIELPLSEMQPIPGDSPDPVDVSAGCSYAPRCPLATEECQTVDPERHRKTTAHWIDCHHWEAVDDEIALPTAESTGSRSQTTATGRQCDSTGAPLVSLTDVTVQFESDTGLLTRLFGTESTVQAVDGISLDVYENDVVVIVGESGCGKSTLGKTAVGIQEPTSGSVEYRGQDIWDARRRLGGVKIPWGEIRQRLQIVHQDPGSALNPNRRIGAALGDPLKRWHKEKRATQRRATILTLLEEVGLTPADDYIDRYPHQLSGGEQQRVAIIRAFLTNPELIFADEPISALDVSLRVEIMNLMIRLQELFGTSFLFVSHDLANARYIAERTGGRIGVMYLGELVELGPAERVIGDPQHPYTQALRWATPELIPDEDDEETPIDSIDVPDPRDIGPGCQYRSRCQYARTACETSTPKLTIISDGDGSGGVRCFRADPDHEYWESEPISEEEQR
jgi:peptide/nickel transport system ATP-binding protein